MQIWSTERRIGLYDACLDHWGHTAQVDMLVEELLEAGLATQKYFKRDNSQKRVEDLATEFADVLLMIEEISWLLDGVTPPKDMPEGKRFTDLVSEQLAFKLSRTTQRLEESIKQREAWNVGGGGFMTNPANG